MNSGFCGVELVVQGHECPRPFDFQGLEVFGFEIGFRSGAALG